MGNRVSITKMMYGWSKYGGPRYGLIKGEKDWFCQACGSKQAKELGQYMIPINNSNREFARVCGICKHMQAKHKLNYKRLCIKIRVKETYEQK